MAVNQCQGDGLISDVAPLRGQWACAPVVFVLAQVRFLPNAAAAPENLRDAITRRVGPRFPTVSQTTGPAIEISLDAEPAAQRQAAAAAYDLINENVDAMVRVQPDALTYAVTSYPASPRFRENWLEIAAALQDVGVVTVSRVGLRYVDFVLPREGRVPEDYVQAPWNLSGMPELPGAEGSPDLHVSLFDLRYPAGRMRLQFMRGFGIPSLPMDLQGMLSPRQEFSPTQPMVCGVIDTDRWIDGEHPTDAATLNQLFTRMHKEVSDAFNAMITPLAKGEWNPQSANGDKA
jgi:uncharacterized protein (TIGR04255 family)